MVIASFRGLSSILGKRTLIRLAKSEFRKPGRMEEKRFEQAGSMERSESKGIVHSGEGFLKGRQGFATCAY